LTAVKNLQKGDWIRLPGDPFWRILVVQEMVSQTRFGEQKPLVVDLDKLLENLHAWGWTIHDVLTVRRVMRAVEAVTPRAGHETATSPLPPDPGVEEYAPEFEHPEFLEGIAACGYVVQVTPWTTVDGLDDGHPDLSGINSNRLNVAVERHEDGCLACRRIAQAQAASQAPGYGRI
jgi:hypothetical protein